ncbi:M14 family metallopeptidase [Reichenbachiella agarivorans]|uniref:M14 family metallopeptidase n=1 Tax=Reichenbachiella agarivorans TaxID=2979464 RepID=A0ABY6CQ10_9BACT|nr:M14 family metallopeptidase [Reichenbachiella agarivorans]UXP32592.1 M14 family metallopeptidase [Reichenbachiella agarivorans]
MMIQNLKSCFLLLLFTTSLYPVIGQDILPPVLPWSGASEQLIADPSNPWITASEKSELTETPNYEETMAWFKKLSDASPVLKMITIGTSAQGRAIQMIIASGDKTFTSEKILSSSKPTLLVQAGIHAGEIDGKDAGMMLLRDIAFGSKGDLIKKVNFLFIPILNVDGHESVSEYGRVNQRGPKSMGWRTNARNLNLNRDYSKLETEGVRAVVTVINTYDPDLYIDLHVTDGADYQFDITYGWGGDESNSPEISQWLKSALRPAVDQALQENGHVPGPLMFAFNDEDFSEGNTEFAFSPRFSETYGASRYTPSILVENHSLKPYDQRVLGTYVLLEQTLRTLADQGKTLSKAIGVDRALRLDTVALAYDLSESLADSMDLRGIESVKLKSEITGEEYVQWTGKPIEQKIVVRKMNEVTAQVSRAKAYWIPAEWGDIIQKLKMHGVQVEVITQSQTVEVEQYRIEDYKHAARPFEGKVRVEDVTVSTSRQTITYSKGSARVTTDQPLGLLVTLLLEPQSPDSFLQWGYFHSIFSRTEYIEKYVMEPLAKQMLASDPALKSQFEEKMKEEVFANSPDLIYQWFYAQTPYYDQQWKLYPIARE